jgi:hypothetical protein
LDFGKVGLKELVDINFNLLDDSFYTKQVFGNVPRELTYRFYIGGAKWVRLDWVVVLYPKGTKLNKYLRINLLNRIECIVLWLTINEYYLWVE